MGAGSRCGRRPRTAGLYAWHCLRERPRRRGPQEDGDGAGGAGRAGLRPRPRRASSSRLAAGTHGGGPAAGRGSGSREGSRGEGRPGPAARGAVPVVRGLAHQAGRLCFLPSEVAVEGQHRGVAMLGLCGQTVRSAGPVPVPAPRCQPARPPAARRTKGRGRYLGPCAPGTQPPPAGSTRSSAPSSGPPLRSGTAAAAARPTPAGSARRLPRAPGGPTAPTPADSLCARPPPSASGPQIDTYGRAAAGTANGGQYSGSGGGRWPQSGQSEPAERLGPGREC